MDDFLRTLMYAGIFLAIVAWGTLLPRVLSCIKNELLSRTVSVLVLVAPVFIMRALADIIPVADIMGVPATATIGLMGAWLAGQQWQQRANKRP